MSDRRPPADGDEMLDTGAGPPDTRRWMVALGLVAAAVIALLVARVSTNSPAAFVTAAANPEGATVNLSGSGVQLHMDHFEHGFDVKVTVAGDHLGSLPLMQRLRRLIEDERIVGNR